MPNGKKLKRWISSCLFRLMGSRTRWNIENTEVDNGLIAIKDVFNLSGDDFREHLSENLYAPGQESVLIKRKGNVFLLKPIHKNDHLVTQFAKIKADPRGENLLRLTICYSMLDSPGENCAFLIQDEKYNSLLAMQCYLPDGTLPAHMYEKRYILIPGNVESIRINITSTDGIPTFLPEVILLEHAVHPNLDEIERNETDRITKEISGKNSPARRLLSSKVMPEYGKTNIPVLEDNLISLKRLFYLSGVLLREGLNENSYETGRKTKILFKMGKSSFFLKPIHQKDHLVTQFVKVNIDERGTNLLRLVICYSEENHPGENCALVIQDEKFNTILSVPCHLAEGTGPRARYAIEYSTIPPTIESVRLSICSTNGSATALPETIILEHAVIDSNSLTETRKNELSHMVNIISRNAELSTFLDFDGTPFYSLSDYEKMVSSYSREELQKFFRDDPWFANYLLNILEFVQGETVLTTYPWTICIPIADNCNATCPFCTSWIRGTRQLDLNESDNFLHLLQNAKLLGFAGHGEPLMHTEFETIARRIHETIDRRCVLYLVTNGILLEQYLDLLLDINVQTFNISLNASTPETYHKIMGQNAFNRIISCIERLVATRQKSEKHDVPIVNISMVVINQNIHEAASFVELGNRLKVNNIHLNTLMPQSQPVRGLNYHTLPPYLNPRFAEYQGKAIKAISASGLNVIGSPEAWATPIFPKRLEEQFESHPPKIYSKKEIRKNRADYRESIPEISKGHPLSNIDRSAKIEEVMDDNPYGRTPGYGCRDIYYNLNLNDFLFRLNPCCYMWDIPGFEPIIYDGGYDFFEAWNSPAMVELRRRLKDGPLYSFCKRCPPHST